MMFRLVSLLIFSILLAACDENFRTAVVSDHSEASPDDLTYTAPSKAAATVPSGELLWNDQVVIASNSHTGFTSNCGWYGCRVAALNSDRGIDMVHGGYSPQGFYLRKDISAPSNTACVQWNDKVTIASSSAEGDTPNCGLYGCRVLSIANAPKVTFTHGGEQPTSFYVRSPVGTQNTGCVNTHDKVVLSATNVNYNSGNCGWYGCRVLQFDERNAPDKLYVYHGKDDPQGVYLRSYAQTLSNNETEEWTVSSLLELRDAITDSDQTIVMRPGNYSLTELPAEIRNLEFSGSRNTIDLEGVYVDVPVGSTAQASYIVVDGSNNTILGGTFEDTYTNGLTEVTDFVGYNSNTQLAYGLRGAAVMSILGNNNLVDGIKMTIRGSFPYGYGSIFGIGAPNSFGLSKRCGILVRGNNNTIDNAEVQQRAFCHGIYMQSPADNTTIRNTLVEGRVRETNDMLQEGEGSLPARNSYLTIDGVPIAPDEVNSLAEDGIRSYSSTGSVVVENSTVLKMRGGIRLYLASSATVSNSTALDSGATNFNMPKGGSVTNSSANFTYAPLSDFRLSRSNQNLEFTILPSPNAIGSHNIADILGNGHTIVFHRADGPLDSGESRAFVVYGNNSTITNETEYAIVLQAGTSGNRIVSAGDVIDNGNNEVTQVEVEL